MNELNIKTNFENWIYSYWWQLQRLIVGDLHSSLILASPNLNLFYGSQWFSPEFINISKLF